MIALDPWPEELSDETLAQLSEYLHRIAEDFETRYWTRIRRYYRSVAPPMPHPGRCHKRQLHLFDDACTPF